MASHLKEHGKSIQASFNEFHRLNPEIYEEYKILALKAIKAGHKRISSNMIINVIRWEFFISTKPTLFDKPGKHSKYKINNDYSSRYARLFAHDFPQHADKLEMRTLLA